MASDFKKASLYLTSSQLSFLRDAFSKYSRIAIAYSGGVDSRFLAKIAEEIAPNKTILVSIVYPYMASYQKKAQGKNITTLPIIYDSTIDFSVLLSNPPERCYICKKMMFSRIIEIAKKLQVETVFDATTTDEYNLKRRPGLIALKELKVIHPLYEAGIHKETTVKWAKENGYYIKPFGCLLTLFRFNRNISLEELAEVDKKLDA